MPHPPSRRLAPICLVLGILSLWPALLTNGIFVFSDTFRYEAAGEAALDLLTSRLSPEEPFSDVPAGGSNSDDTPPSTAPDGSDSNLRSAVWSICLALLGGVPVGALVLGAGQAAATLFALGLLAPARPDPLVALAGTVALILATGLPWYAAYAMPDLLGALLIAVYAVLGARWAVLSPVLRAVLILLGTYAVLGHYGHLPLAAVLTVAVAILAAMRRRAGLAAAAAAPLALALAVNAAISLSIAVLLPATPSQQAGPATANEPVSMPRVTPGRLPIVLARSVEDGPALWHLREACAQDRYRSCDFLDLSLTTVGDVLWSEAGFAGMSPAQRAVLRSEEARIVRNAAWSYPMAQAAAVARNAARQFAAVGVDEHVPWSPEGRPAGRTDMLALKWADRIVPLMTAAAGIALLGAWATGRVGPPLRSAGLLVLIGLGANAAIYGGLSYPVDRYQGRAAWLIPAYLLLILLWRRSIFAEVRQREP